jgi:PPP family 3-phenylpropionic acid transporter
VAQAPVPSSAPALFAARCAIAYAAALGINGILLPFFPVWLKSIAFDDFQIGLILSIPIVLRVISGPIAGLIADRLQERARVLVVSASCSIATALALMAVDGFWLVLFIFSLQGVVFAPFMPVLESITVMGVRRWGFRYGSIRVWGSIGFVATTLMAGQAISAFGSGIVPLAAALAFLMLLAAAFVVPRLGRAASRPTVDSAGVAAQASVRPELTLLMIGATLVQSTHGMYYAFSGIHWQDMGFTGNQIGILWSAGVMAEILFFFASGAVARRIPPTALIIIGSVVAIGRWILFAQPLGFAASLLLQCSHAFTFAFLHFGVQQKIVEVVHESRESAVQGTYFFYAGGFLAASTFLSGVIYKQFGQESYYLMALVAALGLGLCFAAARRQPQRAGEGG